MARSGRIIAVTLGLVAAGAIVGAASAIGIVVAVVGPNNPADVLRPSSSALLATIAAFGALAGGLIAPTILWGLLRRVALGRALAWIAAAAVVGGALGERVHPLNPYVREVPAVLIGSLTGVVMASLMLRLRQTLDERRAGARAPAA